MLNKWLTIAGVACVAVPLVHFLPHDRLSKNEPYVFAFLALVGGLLLIFVSFRIAAMAAGLSDRTANLALGAIAIGQWFVAKVADLSSFEQLVSNTAAAGGLLLVLMSLAVRLRTQGLRQ